MRFHDEPLAEDEVEPWYVEDLPGLACLIECDNCKTKQPSKHGEEDETCNGCNKFFVYRPWWEW